METALFEGKTCRLCAEPTNNPVAIYSEEGAASQLAKTINLYLPVQVSESDSLPLYLCYKCATTVVSWHELANTCLEAQEKLLELNSLTIFSNEHISASSEPTVSIKEDDNGSEIDNTENCEVITVIKDDGNSKTPTEEIGIDSRDDRKQFFCVNCDKAYSRQSALNKHLREAHNIKDTKHEMQTERKHFIEKCRLKDGKTLQCPMCNYVTLSAWCLTRHHSIHTGEKFYYCERCGKSFRSSGSFHRHIREFHDKIKRFACDQCDKTFRAKASLQEHKNIHLNIRPYVCDTCGATFTQKATLFTHKLFHTGDKKFSCNSCDRKFRRQAELKAHSLIHTKERPHACTKCPSTFRLKQDLRRHLLVHDKLVECKCNICGSVFNQERYLTLHMRSHRPLVM